MDDEWNKKMKISDYFLNGVNGGALKLDFR